MNNYTFIGIKNKATGKCISNDSLRDDAQCDARGSSFIQASLGNQDRFILLNTDEKQCIKQAVTGGYVMDGMREDYACKEFDKNDVRNGIQGYQLFAKKRHTPGPPGPPSS